MNVTAFIFARGGSKGLPGKNIRMLGGKPLIAWSIEQALSVERIGRVIVSTDSLEIASVAQEYGALVPFMRPSDLASDSSPEWLSWQHALNYLLASEGELPDAMISVPATSPLRLPVDLENALDEYEKGGSDVVLTVTKAHRNPYFNMVKKDQDDFVSLVIPPAKAIAFRQSTPEVFDLTTVAYVANPLFILSSNSIFEGRVKSVSVPFERSIDIDDLIDFQMAEFFLTLQKAES